MSVIGRFQIPFVFHVTVAPVAVPVSSTNACPVVFVSPLALFQFDFCTTPATSVLPITVPCPTKSILITFALVVVTTRLTVAVCVVLPLVPVIVTVDVPAGAVLAVVTVSVEVPDPVTVAGEKLAVAPLGNPLALSVTTPAKPFNDPIVAVYVVEFPTTTVCVLGLPEIEKSGGGGVAFTTRLTVVACVSVPLVPVIVSVDVPTGVLPDVVTVKVELPDPVIVVGEKLAVVPARQPARTQRHYARKAIQSRDRRRVGRHASRPPPSVNSDLL